MLMVSVLCRSSSMLPGWVDIEAVACSQLVSSMLSKNSTRSPVDFFQNMIMLGPREILITVHCFKISQ